MRILIIGGEAAGMSAAAKARRLAKDAEIVVYEASEVISFGACGLPYFVGDEFQEPGYMAEFTPEQGWTEHTFDLTPFIGPGLRLRFCHEAKFPIPPVGGWSLDDISVGPPPLCE